MTREYPLTPDMIDYERYSRLNAPGLPDLTTWQGQSQLAGPECIRHALANRAKATRVERLKGQHAPRLPGTHAPMGEPKTPRPRQTPDERRARARAYFQRWRAAHPDAVRGYRKKYRDEKARLRRERRERMWGTAA